MASGQSPKEVPMPRNRVRPRPLIPPKYSSLWFAMKAIQTQNSKLLANNSSITTKPLINYNQNSSLMNGSDMSRGDGQLMDSSGIKIKSPDGTQNGPNNEESAISADIAIDTGIEVFEVNDTKSLVLMKESGSGYELSFGCIRLTLLSNNFHLNINGYDLSANQTIEIMTAFGHKIWIQMKDEGNHLKTDLSDSLKDLGVDGIEKINKQLEDNSCLILVEKLCSAPLLYIENMPNFKTININTNPNWFQFKAIDSKSNDFIKVWNKLFDELNLCDTDVIVVTGSVNVGKSSLIRHFINRYLSGQQLDESPSCFYLDCDPGQSEFSTSAQLSLTQVDRPLLSSATMNVLSHRPLMSCSVGATTPSKEPRTYISSVIQLVNHFNENFRSKKPLFVNTMGWTRDLGLALLSDTIKLCNPTHVIQINSSVSTKSNFEFDLTPESVQRFPGYHLRPSEPGIALDYKLSILESNNRESKRSQLTRVSQQLAYFSKMPDIVFKPFFAMTPYKIHWSKVLLHIVSNTRISPQLYLDALNLSWVHLCRLDATHQRVFRWNSLQIVNSIKGNQCFGSAVIRGIDFENRVFYVLTPESPEVIDSINCIVRPSGVFVPDIMITEQVNYSNSSAIPYTYHKS